MPGEAQVVRLKMPLAFNDFMRLMKIDKPALKYPPFRANTPKPFDPEEDLFAEIRERDLMVFHPYDSFGCGGRSFRYMGSPWYCRPSNRR